MNHILCVVHGFVEDQQFFFFFFLPYPNAKVLI